MATATTPEATARPGRNQPCHCGSGRKYKHCCLEKDEKADAATREKAAKAAAKKQADEAESDADSPKQTRTPKPRTVQPWKTATTSRGFAQRTRAPRKVGGS